jgi:molybdopterin synthase catalytic subunit
LHVRPEFFSMEALDEEDLRQAVAVPEAGAILVFAGTVRNHSDGRAGVIALEYEAHASMANRVIAGIVAEVQAECAVQRVALRHRLGRVALGDPAVIIAVSAAHRDEAYQASRRLIDRLKHEAPIWKREIRADGTSEWSRGCVAHAESKEILQNEN